MPITAEAAGNFYSLQTSEPGKKLNFPCHLLWSYKTEGSLLCCKQSLENMQTHTVSGQKSAHKTLAHKHTSIQRHTLY